MPLPNRKSQSITSLAVNRLTEEERTTLQALWRWIRLWTGLTEVAYVSMWVNCSASLLSLESDTAEEHHSTMQVKPSNGALDYQGNGYHAAAGTEGYRAG